MNKSGLAVFLFAVVLLVSTGFSQQLVVDDGVPETESNYPGPMNPTQIAFIDSPLFVLNGSETDYYNLTVEGQLVDGPLNYSDEGFIDTLGTSTESRAVVWNINNSNMSEIDLVENTSDVTGRINNNSLMTNVESVTTHYWLNGSLDGRENASVFGWNNSETLFKMNLTSGMGNYWINVTTGEGTAFEAPKDAGPFSQGLSMPWINDFAIQGFGKINGTVGNASNASQNLENVKLRLRRKTNSFPSRIPYSTAPPEKTTLTDASGEFEFTGLEAGETYLIDVLNSSLVRSEYLGAISRQSGIKLKPGTPPVYNETDFNVTDKTANISVKLIGQQGPRYGFLADRRPEANQTFLKPGVDPNTEYNLTVAAGNHTLLAGKFDFSGGGPPSILTDQRQVEVEEGQTTKTYEIGFPSTVQLTGTVEDDSGNTIPGVQVFAENESERAFQVAETDSSGQYTLNLKNRTGYNVTARPAPDSGYGSNTTTVQMDGPQTQDFTLGEGAYIEGYVNASGNGIEGATVEAWNGSQRSYGSGETNSNGYYKVAGLENVGYEVFVDTPPGYPGNETQVTVTSDNATQNFDLSQENYDLNGTIKNSTGGSTLDATVEIKSLESGFSDSTPTSSGEYSFQDLDSGSYRLDVIPDDESYRDDKEFVRLKGDKEVNFSLSQQSSISGYVKDTNDNSVSDVRLYAYNYSEKSFDTDETDSSGQYDLDVSSVGHTVELYPESNYEFNETSFAASDVGNQKNFTVSSGQYLDGEVKDPGTKNLSGSITVYNKSEGISKYQEFQNGEYNLTGIGNQTGYNVVVTTDESDYGENRTTIEGSVIPGTLDFNFSKQSGPKLWITVEAAEGGTVENATVRVDGEVTETDASGLAKFESREDNSQVTARAGKENYNYTEEKIQVSTSYSTGFGSEAREIQNETLKIENIRGNLVDVDINVTDGSGNGVSGARVVAKSNTSGRISTDIMDADGSGVLEEIRPGSGINYTTAVSANGNSDAANLTFQSGTSGTNSLGSSFSLEWEVPS